MKTLKAGIGLIVLGAVVLLAGQESLGVLIGAIGGAIITTARLREGYRSREDEE